MVKVFIAPRRYVQGADVLKDIGKYVAPLGKRVLVAWGPVVSEKFNDTVKKSFEENDLVLIPFNFSGECDRGQIGRGVEKAKAEKRKSLWDWEAARPSIWPRRWQWKSTPSW